MLYFVILCRFCFGRCGL